MVEDASSSGAPTLEAVAARAGVSRATVSRVVNGSTTVKPEAIRAVQQAIAELDYVPNRAARSLASRRTQTIALIVPESAAKVFADPFFASVVQGVALALARTDYTLTMLIESEADPTKTGRYLRGGNVDGGIVVSHHESDHSYVDAGIPMVFGGRPIDGGESAGPTVDVDNRNAARAAVEHLVERGRTCVATIAGPQDMPPGLDRFAGFREALEAAGLDASLVEFGDFTPASGAIAMRRLLERGVPIDALFAANDQMAIGAYSAIREAGLSIPEDIAVVGFDDDVHSATAVPPLTTVHQPSVDMGASMASILVDLIEGREAPTATLLPTTLVVRQSS
ncbi:LacI family DNA-binding transcriptional regulator [Agromyces seonyuensis]|uniref:Substrate-binding domain-containing protein n=1 Tax=Agromyces seonyuensis TaxID=2662446 RepID=A0A6I4P4A4_9MICO|nr:LacI family DNA-binding transcriptional regulator [Agromyces seonyuensis]MWB98094.1 substrate-binding domain-containing protein [Agromyces seonyuensis]